MSNHILLTVVFPTSPLHYSLRTLDSNQHLLFCRQIFSFNNRCACIWRSTWKINATLTPVRRYFFARHRIHNAFINPKLTNDPIYFLKSCFRKILLWVPLLRFLLFLHYVLAQEPTSGFEPELPDYKSGRLPLTYIGDAPWRSRTFRITVKSRLPYRLANGAWCRIFLLHTSYIPLDSICKNILQVCPWACWIRTNEVQESKSCVLPLD